MNKIIILFIIFLFSNTLIFSNTCSVNLKFLILSHPEMSSFDFEKKCFTDINLKKNEEYETSLRLKSLLSQLKSSKSSLKAKLQILYKHKPVKISLINKIEKTIIFLNKKIKSISNKLEIIKSTNKFLPNGSIYTEMALKKIKKINNEICKLIRIYSIKHDIDCVIDTSLWSKMFCKKKQILNAVENQKNKLFLNEYNDFFEKKDKKHLKLWYLKGLNSALDYKNDCNKFILYGAKDITNIIYLKLRKGNK